MSIVRCSTLEELYREVEHCELCPYAQLGNKKVNGDGKIGAPIMIIGQAPGRTELEIGKPYTGPSGRLLRNMLRKMKIPQGDVYFSNVLRCAPPEGKNIVANSLKMCMRWVVEEIELVRPRLIVLLGAVAAKAVIDKETIEECKGKIIKCGLGIPCVATYHTAYLIRIRKDEDIYESTWHEVRGHWKLIHDTVYGRRKQ